MADRPLLLQKYFSPTIDVGLPGYTCIKKQLIMATVATNPLINGLSGMLGKSIVFRTFRNKTVVAAAPSPPKRQSEQQRANRSKFREATAWAQATLQNPERKAYYQKKAKKLGLPNAYTAAITDYMRKPQAHIVCKENNEITCCVYKKDFVLKEVRLTTSAGESIEVKTLEANANGECFMIISEKDFSNASEWYVTDAIGRMFRLQI